MARLDLDDTIVAVSTAVGEGAVGIVRVSGPRALSVVDKIFLARSRQALFEQPDFTMRLGWIVREACDRATPDGRPREAVDEVLVSVMRAPKSYTREDVVEVNAHGGMRALEAILKLILEGGARLAEPGEFTRRAFLNGRLDLAQAEAVLDVVRAKGDWALKNSERQLLGALSRVFSEIRDHLIRILADMEAVLDFPEEETGAADARRFTPLVAQVAGRMDAHLERSARGRLMREGLKAVIAGRTNVGKSSLLNALLRQERAIVTAVPGTTRDTIEEIIHIQGLAVHLIDTAGIITARDAVEVEALARSRKALEEAGLVLFVLDGSVGLEDDDRRLFESFADKAHLIVINKSDLPRAWGREALRGWTTRPVIDVSARTGDHIMELEAVVLKSVFDGPPAWDEGAWVANVRHIEALRRGREGLTRTIDSLEKGLSLDVVALDVRAAADSIGEITGAVCTEEILDTIFSKFCIGK